MYKQNYIKCTMGFRNKQKLSLICFLKKNTKSVNKPVSLGELHTFLQTCFIRRSTKAFYEYVSLDVMISQVRRYSL